MMTTRLAPLPAVRRRVIQPSGERQTPRRAWGQRRHIVQRTKQMLAPALTGVQGDLE